jgi:hypothetical protein
MSVEYGWNMMAHYRMNKHPSGIVFVTGIGVCLNHPGTLRERKINREEKE